MRIRSALASVFMLAGLLAVTVPAEANELRESKAHFIVDVPDSWKVSTEGNFAVAYPKDESFHLRMQGTSHGLTQEEKDEEHAISFLRGHFSDIHVTRHAKHVEWNNFKGVEVFGTGTEANGSAGKFFLLLIVDKKDNTKGAVVVGTGTTSGFDKHHPGIYEALHSMRTY